MQQGMSSVPFRLPAANLDPPWPDMPKEREVWRSGKPALSVPLRNLPWVVNDIHSDFRRGVASCQNQAPTNASAPLWRGVVTWARVCEILRKEIGRDANFGGDSEGCFLILKQLAGINMWELKLHDLRIMLLLKEKCIPPCEFAEVQTLFSEEPHSVALSYQWAASLGEVYSELTSACNLDEKLWVDIVFNPQGARVDSRTVIPLIQKADLEYLVIETNLGDEAADEFEKVPNSDLRLAGGIERLRALSNYEIDQGIANESAKVGDELFAKGKYLECLCARERELEATTRVYGRDDLNVAKVLDSIGCVYSEMGKHKEAFDTHKQSLQIDIKNLGNDHATVAASLNHLGLVCNRLGDNNKALEYFERALAVSTKVLGQEHADVAATLMNIGGVYLTKGENEQALATCKQASAIIVQKLGHDHENVARSLDVLGLIYWKLGKNKEAVEMFEKSLRITTKNLGHEHMGVAAVLYNLGTIYCAEGENEQAMTKFVQALRIQVKNLGHDHPDVAKSLSSIGIVYQNLGKNQQALTKHKDALRIQLKAMGGEHMDVARCLDNLGIVYQRLGNFNEALEKHEQALRITVKNVGHSHTEVTSRKNEIAALKRRAAMDSMQCSARE